jgi:hypothetical protein
MHTSTTYPYVFFSDPFGRRTTVSVCVLCVLSEQHPPAAETDDGTGYSNKIYFSCQNLTTCRLCIALKSRVARSFVQVFSRCITSSRKSWPSPGSLFNQPARLGIFLFLSFSFLFSSLPCVSDLYPNPSSFDCRLIVSHVKRDTGTHYSFASLHNSVSRHLSLTGHQLRDSLK